MSEHHQHSTCTACDMGIPTEQEQALRKALVKLADTVEWIFGGTDELTTKGPMRNAYNGARRALR